MPKLCEGEEGEIEIILSDLEKKRMSEQAHILGLLNAVWQLHPEWRLGQLLENVLLFNATPHDCIFHVADTSMAKTLEGYLSADK